MVLRLLAILSTGFQQTPSPALMEQCRVEADRLMGIVCRTDRGGQLNKYLQVKPQVEFRSSMICVWYINGGVLFSKDGRLRGIGFTPYEFPHELQTILTEDQAKVETREYAKRLGVPIANSRIHCYPKGPFFETLFIPTFDGIPFDTEWYVTIERESGYLTSYRPGKIPRLHGSARPSITAEQATASALSAMARFIRYDQFVVSDTDLVLRVPVFFSGPREMTDEQIGIARSGEAIPIYGVRINRGESWRDDMEGYSEFCFVYVDGRNGRTMAIVEMSKFLMSGVPIKSPKTLITLSSALGIRTDEGLKWFTGWKDANAPTKEPTAMESLVLQTKNGAVRAKFDRAGGRLAIPIKDGTKWLKPGRAMLAAIEWDVANPMPSFGSKRG
ncbi:MAG: hypothetical protein IT203_12955 [Fimbriimonadaceae bacterium]|nr:hypothetical protein [Fimbriimonadaceae bacterium]